MAAAREALASGAAVAADSRRAAARSSWMRELLRWHWISAALSLVGMLGFAITGITLNHAAQIPAAPVTTTQHAVLPQELHQSLAALAAAADGEAAQNPPPTPVELRRWLRRTWGLSLSGRTPEWSAEELYIALPRAGGDGWVSIDLASGDAEYETTERGWVSYFNDLHKGRNTGGAWNWFIDVFALACVVFSVTGLLLLQVQAAGRRSTWPLVGLGLLLPLLLALLFLH
jgi:hypothetical protein